MRSILPSFLPSIPPSLCNSLAVQSFLPTFLQAFIRSTNPFSFYSFNPLIVHSFIPSFIQPFLSSILPLALPTTIPSFILSSLSSTLLFFTHSFFHSFLLTPIMTRFRSLHAWMVMMLSVNVLFSLKRQKDTDGNTNVFIHRKRMGCWKNLLESLFVFWRFWNNKFYQSNGYLTWKVVVEVLDIHS